MILFQNIITQKHIASQYGKIKPAYELFAAYFHNAAIQRYEWFDTLDFAAFVRELGKQKLPLSLKAQDEWEEYFTDSRNSCQTITTAITNTDRLVYTLYALTEEEIPIIEK